MARKNKKTVVLAAGHGEPDWPSSQMKIAQDLPSFYDLGHDAQLSLPDPKPIENADALMVVGPQFKLDDKALWTIDQAIMRGIPDVFLIDTKRFSPGQFMVMPENTGLVELLKHYGVNVTDRLVYDSQSESVGMTQNVGGLAFTTRIRYPFILSLTH